MKQSVFLQANGPAFPYVSDILKHRRWNDNETLLQFDDGFNIICADPELFLGERAGIRGGNFVNEIMVKNIYP